MYLFARVNFHITAKLGFGESIRICGNIPALGNNANKNSLELVTTPEKCGCESFSHVQIPSLVQCGTGKGSKRQGALFQRPDLLRHENDRKSFTNER